MAGGVGSRFWPASTQKKPKQFLDILGTGETLLQATYRRFKNVCDTNAFMVVTNIEYKNLVLEQLPELSENQILCEPFMRNTAPCIAYAAYKIASQTNEANLIVTPADHLITKETVFNSIVEKALAHTSTYNHLLTLGIKPSRPDTGYGYIEFTNDGNEFQKVMQFREKPDLHTARQFVSSGNFVWNSGMFFWSLASVLDAFEEHLPEINTLFKASIINYNTPNENQFIEEAYQHCPNISIDYGIMEKASNVFTISADIGWSDLGTWGSVYTHLEVNPYKNAIGEQSVVLENTSNSLIRLPKGKAAIIEGLDGYIVVDSGEALLIIRKSEEQRIKQLREKLGKKFGDKLI